MRNTGIPTGCPKAVGVQKSQMRGWNLQAEPCTKAGQQLVPPTDPVSRGNPLLSCTGPEPPLPLTLPLAHSHLCRPVRHLPASLPLHRHSTHLLASHLWPKALLLTPGHVGLLLGLLSFPILTEHLPAEASAAATFHSETSMC